MPQPLKLLLISLFFSLANLPLASAAVQPLKIVTSFSILQDITQNLAGNKALVTSLVPANSDAHVYQPKPSDARLLAEADMVVENGLGFEGWLSRLLEASNFKGTKIIASQGIKPIYKANNPKRIDPHAWHSFSAVRIYINNINTALIKLSPENTEYFNQQKVRYLNELNQLEQELKDLYAAKLANKSFLVPHAAFAYLEAEFNIKLLAPQGISTASEPSAAQLAKLLTLLKDKNIQGIFTENLSSTKFMQQLSQSSGVPLRGMLYSDSLSTHEGEAASYLLLMQYNLKTLATSID